MGLNVKRGSLLWRIPSWKMKLNIYRAAATKRPKRLRISCALILLICAKAHAQFYAPDTEFHDKAQRLFVVEAARVLAWRENLEGERIAEIKYTVDLDGRRTTTWSLTCLDDKGQAVKQFRVNYPETLLSQGPGFYRKVFKQVWIRGTWRAASNLDSTELNEAYWNGAELNGMSREEGLHAAFKLIGPKPSLPEGKYAPVLAGLLAHEPMPSLCGGFTMDAMLLARGAAWLAFSESMLKDASSAADENWAPILFMAGRENAAAALWKDKIKAGQGKQNQATLFQWWDFFLRQPKARAAFEFVTDPKQRRFGMPMMTYYSRLEGLGNPLAEVLVPLYGKNLESFSKLYNYGGFLEASTSVGGGRLLEGAWPAIFRQEWVNTLRDFPASAHDYNGYADKLKAISSSNSPAHPNESELSLAGLSEVAPLLELGYEQGTGSLIPVATVTARDLLNYGWEMNGLQMGARYYFVRRKWCIPDLAETIYQRGTRDIGGQAPFFPGNLQGKVFNLQETLYRLQMVDDLGWRVNVDIQPFAKDPSNGDGARLFYKRCWLRPYEIRWQSWVLAKANLPDEQLQVMQRYHAECGPKSDVLTLEYLGDWFTDKDFDARPKLKQLREQIAEAAAEPTELQVTALYHKRYAGLANAEKAQDYEKIFWENPDCRLQQDVFNNYISGGAWKSAKRFYTQVRNVVSRDVEFSNMLAPQAWMMGFLTGDEDLMDMALEDSDTGSYSSMVTAIWHAAAHERTDEMEKQLDGLIERYESEEGPRSQGRMIKSFIPLIPALKNPKDPLHGDALDHFGKSENGVLFRWILIREYKLSVEDAIRFLGGKETDLLRRILVLHLQNDKGPMHQAFFDYISAGGNRGAGRPLVTWAAGELQNLPSTFQQVDLKPPGVKSIQQAVSEKLHELSSAAK
jgi:hypothetical protein